MHVSGLCCAHTSALLGAGIVSPWFLREICTSQGGIGVATRSGMSASSSLLPDSSGYSSNSAAWVDIYPRDHMDRQTPASALGRRWHRERRRRKIGRAYDMALEIAR